MLQMHESYERKTTFRVGDRVRTLTNEQVKESGRLKFERGDAPDLWTNTKCQLCGKTGTVDDVYRSAKYGCTIYTVRFDGATAVSNAVFVADDLVPIHEYSYAFDWTDETCTALLKDGDRVIATATAKLFNRDPLGYANADSMAAKFLYFDLKEQNDDLTRLEGTATGRRAGIGTEHSGDL